jgi:hypothetical protein
MRRTRVGWLAGLLLGAGVLGAQPPSEKTDARKDRSLTGTVEKVDARAKGHGFFTVRSSGPRADKGLYRYELRIEPDTRLLNARGKELEGGLNRLKGAEVRVVLVDRKGEHVARTVQLIRPARRP